MSPAAAAFTSAAFHSGVSPAIPSSSSPDAEHASTRAGSAVAAAVATAAAVAVIVARQPSSWPATLPPPGTRRARRRLRLSPLAADAIAGAAGELVQIAFLYPLDTLKVVCQAYDCSAKDALRRLLPPGTPLWSAAPALYRGCLPAAGLSAVIGALYLVAFNGGRAMALEADAAAARAAPGGGKKDGARRRSLGARPAASDTALPSPSSSGYGGPVTLAGAGGAAAGAAASCLATSLIEAPLEMFRHRMQAGAAGGAGLAAQALAALRAGGPRELYRGYASFLLKSFPYDAAELVTYALLADAGSSLAAAVPAVSAMPGGAGALVGALAGAAAVVASMPADCVKLRLELGTGPPPPTTRAAVRQFFSTGAAIARGPGGGRALFRGLGPRLAEKVPSTAAYWLVVEAVRRGLKQFVADEAAEDRLLVAA